MERALYIWPNSVSTSPIQCASVVLPFVSCSRIDYRSFRFLSTNTSKEVAHASNITVPWYTPDTPSRLSESRPGNECISFRRLRLQQTQKGRRLRRTKTRREEALPFGLRQTLWLLRKVFERFLRHCIPWRRSLNCWSCQLTGIWAQCATGLRRISLSLLLAVAANVAREARSACEHERCLRSARKRTYCVLPDVVRSREANAFAQLRAKPAPRCDALMSEAIASQRSPKQRSIFAS